VFSVEVMLSVVLVFFGPLLFLVLLEMALSV
jgi:hypothetical protein